jgi:hypothetical protein
MARQQPSKEACIQLGGVAVVYRDLRRIQSLDEPADEIIYQMIFLLGHEVRKLRSEELRIKL